ncbi:MAG TPA: glycine cleavage T C-terminal barrel domain-containing protein [Tepidisphaeraceae bacterium]|nr:glycine cleavage T C-terminal barrel domain-containing protein [Tepidisphaeraceae bacterium]
MEQIPQIPNPLLELHQSVDADMQSFGSIEIVSTFGQPQLEYAALHKSCGIMDLPFRGALLFTGRDRCSFLNGLISNQTWDKETKQPMPAGGGVYSFLLNLKGRIVADMRVIELGDVAMMIADVTLIESLKDVFDKYLFAEQVKMQSAVGVWHPFLLIGPKAREVLAAVAGEGGKLSDVKAGRLAIDGVEVVVFEDNLNDAPAACLLVPTDSAVAIWTRLTAEGAEGAPLARGVGWAAFNARRIEAGHALCGIDFAVVSPATAYPARKLREAATTPAEETGPGVLPAETGALFRRAVSLSKCYVGQEIVARMHARQQVPRMLAGFKMLDDSLPIAGSPVFDAEQNQIGIVTSSTVSPVRGNASIGFAFLKKPHFAPGTKLTIPAEGSMRTATVVELPLA